ncbi:hypothetical protein [Celeribacter arenosi]|uniref:SnoaL-like domain-containing protein n=1 Tax=Celeribacter arenosi TaxID=792649 RepID=A0ABP7JS57_9RHOB
MQTRVTRSPECGNAPENARAEAIALALMGVGRLEEDALAEIVTWDRSQSAVVVGREAVSHAVAKVDPPASISLAEVVTHGRAGTVSGRMTRDGAGTVLFCHVIRFTSPSTHQIAQLVSFERQEVSHG